MHIVKKKKKNHLKQFNVSLTPNPDESEFFWACGLGICILWITTEYLVGLDCAKD